MAFILAGRTQTADATPYDNSITQFQSPCDDVQTAIERLKQYAENVARFCVACGFDGTASTGRWLEFITNNPSNSTPFVIPKNAYLREITISCSSNSTSTTTIFKNSLATQSITLSNQRKKSETNLNISFNSLDEISVQVTSGSASKPMVFMFFVFS